MILISFDLGIKNLSYCILDETLKIHDWKVVNLLEGNTKSTRIKSITVERCVRFLLKYLEEAEFPTSIQHVLIESQPGGGRSANARMKNLSHSIQSFFYLRYPHAKITFVSPKRKLELCGGMFKSNDSKKRYDEHKRRAIVTTDNMVKESEWYSWYSKLKKRDDAADSYLQGRWFIQSMLKVE